MDKKIAEICENLCCKKLLWNEQLIVSGILDSYQIMELICKLEEEFDIKYEPEEITNLDNFSCINSIIEITKKKSERF